MWIILLVSPSLSSSSSRKSSSSSHDSLRECRRVESSTKSNSQNDNYRRRDSNWLSAPFSPLFPFISHPLIPFCIRMWLSAFRKWLHPPVFLCIFAIHLPSSSRLILCSSSHLIPWLSATGSKKRRESSPCTIHLLMIIYQCYTEADVFN